MSLTWWQTPKIGFFVIWLINTSMIVLFEIMAWLNVFSVLCMAFAMVLFFDVVFFTNLTYNTSFFIFFYFHPLSLSFAIVKMRNLETWEKR